MEKKKGKIRKVSFWIITAVVFLCVGTAILTTSPIYLKKCRLTKGGNFGKYLHTKNKQCESKEFTGRFIKNAELNLKVRNYEAVSRKTFDLVNNFSGLIIDSSIENYPNEAKKGSVVLKIPPNDFDRVICQLKKFGKVNLVRITREDVTDEYADIEARLNNFYAVKERVFKALKSDAPIVESILEAEESRKDDFDKQIQFATITVNFYEPRLGFSLLALIIFIGVILIVIRMERWYNKYQNRKK